MNQFSNKYDLEERTAKFGETIIEFCKSLKQDAISKPIISQLVRSGTSVGANYMEANGASSKQDFRNKIFICKKEAQETKHWLRRSVKRNLLKKDEIDKLKNIIDELSPRLSAYINSIKNNQHTTNY